MTRSLITAAFAGLILVACGGGTESDEAAATHAQLEEDETLIDDAPIGEPSVMHLTSEHGAPEHQPTGIEGHLPIPPASRAIQPTPMLPGGPGTEASSSAPVSQSPSATGALRPSGDPEPSDPGATDHQGEIPAAPASGESHEQGRN